MFSGYQNKFINTCLSWNIEDILYSTFSLIPKIYYVKMCYPNYIRWALFKLIVLSCDCWELFLPVVCNFVVLYPSSALLIHNEICKSSSNNIWTWYVTNILREYKIITYEYIHELREYIRKLLILVRDNLLF